MGTITRGIANNILGSGAVDGTDGLSGTVPANNIANASLNNLTSFPPSVSAGIPSVAGNPPSPSDGDVWYNTNTYKLRVRGISAPGGSWATGGNLNTARGCSGFGTQTAAIATGGNTSTGYTESYNGTSWTEVNDLNTARNFGGHTNAVGTQSSGMVMGQDDPARSGKTETWNGSSWTEVSDLNTDRRGMSAFGEDATASLCFAGENPGTNMIVDTESWNGSSWTEVNNLNTGHYAAAGVGSTSTAGLCATGRNLDASPNLTSIANNESWNGTSWTEVADVNTTRFDLGSSGTQTAGLIFGGGPSPLAVTESWNGSSWTEIGDLSTARTSITGKGTQTIAWAAGGSTGTASAATEEFTGSADNLDVTLS